MNFFAFLLTGMLAGMLVGMSSSPTVATIIAGVFASIGAIGSLWLGYKESRATAPQIHTWLLPLALGSLIGLLSGVTLKVNDLLRLREPNIRVQLMERGFTDFQANAILDRAAKAESVSSLTDLGSSGPYLLSNQVNNSADEALVFLVAKNRSLPPGELLELVAMTFSGLQPRIAVLQKDLSQTKPDVNDRANTIIDQLLGSRP